MKTVVFLLVAHLCASAVLSLPTKAKEIPPQCIDPTYACQDLENARLCGTVKSCIHDIWSTMSAPDDNDDICQICKEMVKEARDQLLSNMTQEEIKEVFEGSCKLLPVKLIADACIKAVDEFIPELVEMLASRMDPTMVCTVSGLCNLAHLPILGPYRMLLSSITNELPVSNNCDRCTVVVSSVKKMILAIPKDKVIQFINYIVRNAGIELDRLELHDVDSIYEFLTSTLDPKVVCSALRSCPVTCKVSDKLKDELTCEFCTNVLEHVKELVTANTTVEEFRTALYNFCKHTGSFSDKCKAFVDDYFDTLFQYIRTMDSKGVCTLIGLCNNDFCIHTPLVKVVPATVTKKKFPGIKLLPSLVSKTMDPQLQPLVEAVPRVMPSKKGESSDESEMSNEIFGSSDIPLPVDRFSHPLFAMNQNLECNFCKALSFYVKTDLKNDFTWRNVDDVFRNVCQKWNTDMLHYCIAIRNKYSSRMKHRIIESGSVDGICIYAKACPVEDTKSLVVTVMKPKNGSSLCDLCKTACDAIVNQLQDPSIKKKIEKTLYQICNYLPDSMKDSCHDFINENVENLFKILVQELDGDNVCPALHLCPDAMHKVTTDVKDIECDLCKDLVKQMQEKLEEPDVKQSFKNALDKGCAYLPEEVAKECKDFVDQNIDSLVQILVQQLDPNEVCSLLKICPGSTIRIPKKTSDLECDLCKELVEKIEEELKDQSTEEEIKKALDKVCSYFPSSFAAKCEHIVNQYASLMITILADEMDPAMVCASLNICPANLTVLNSWKSKAKDIECEGCYYVFHYIQEQLMNNDSQEELKETLKHLCKLLPGVYKENCDAFVDEFGSSLLTLVAQELDPSDACKTIGACKAMKKQLKLKHNIAEVKTLKLDKCNLCTTVVEYIDKLLEEDDVDKEITALVEKVCHVVPSMEDKCAALVETYGPYILQMIGQLANSTQVCQEIDMCPRVAGHVHLLGGKKCTFGPSYWCQSRVHASACKAELYCHEKVWRVSGVPQ